MLLSLLLGIQVLATIFLGIIVRHAVRMFKIPLTIHNLPIVLMSLLGLTLVMWLSMMHTYLYFMIGMFGVVIMLATADYSHGKITSVIISLSSILIWGQLAIFMIFCLANQDKLEI